MEIWLVFFSILIVGCGSNYRYYSYRNILVGTTIIDGNQIILQKDMDFSTYEFLKKNEITLSLTEGYPNYYSCDVTFPKEIGRDTIYAKSTGVFKCSGPEVIQGDSTQQELIAYLVPIPFDIPDSLFFQDQNFKEDIIEEKKSYFFFLKRGEIHWSGRCYLMRTFYYEEPSSHL